MSDLTFDEYQKSAAEFAIYGPAHAVTYPLLGLIGEVGELAEKFLKLVPLPDQFELAYQLRRVTQVCLRAGQLAKRLRDQGGYPDAEEDGLVAKAVFESARDSDWSGFVKEASDVQWFIAALCTDLRVGLGGAAGENLQKLRDRKNRGVVGGSGDQR